MKAFNPHVIDQGLGSPRAVDSEAQQSREGSRLFLSFSLPFSERRPLPSGSRGGQPAAGITSCRPEEEAFLFNLPLYV